MKSRPYSYKENGAVHTHVLDVRDKEVKSDHQNNGEMVKINANKRKGNLPSSPKSLADLVMPEVLTSTDEKLLWYDSGKDGTDNRIINFATQATMDFLATCPIIFVDGTFSPGPLLSDQMYTIQGV